MKTCATPTFVPQLRSFNLLLLPPSCIRIVVAPDNITEHKTEMLSLYVTQHYALPLECIHVHSGSSK